MAPVLTFLAIATAVGCLILLGVAVRLRSLAQRADVVEDDLCQLRRARRISTTAVAAAAVALAGALLLAAWVG